MASFGFDTTAEEAAQYFQDKIRGKNVLITGASPNSLGAEAARVIAKYGASLLILAGRNKANLQATEEAIKKETPTANIRLVDLDLADLESVKKAAAEVNSYSEPLHVLINNAAIMATPYKPAPQPPYEMQFWNNHVGHFLFTLKLLPKLLSSASSTHVPRIVNVSSRAHLRSPVIFDDMGFSGGEKYDPWIAYGQSKTSNVLFSRQLASLYGDKLLAFSLHPGGIQTNLSRDVEPEAQAALRASLPKDFKFKQIANGSSTHVVAAFSEEIVGENGAYLQDCQVDDVNCKDWAKDMEAARRLFELSEEIVGEKFPAA